MANGGTATSASQSSDLYFRCNHCDASLSVQANFSEPGLECPHCGKATKLPIPAETAAKTLAEPAGETPAKAPVESSVSPPPSEVSGQVAEFQRHLKENESQRTEVTGHINQLNIQMHRWRLRMQTLNARNQELTRQMAEISGSYPPVP